MRVSRSIDTDLLEAPPRGSEGVEKAIALERWVTAADARRAKHTPREGRLWAKEKAGTSCNGPRKRQTESWKSVGMDTTSCYRTVQYCA